MRSDDPERMRRINEMRAKGLTHAAIASALGICSTRVSQLLGKLPPVEKRCRRCGKPFLVKANLASKQQFCGSKSGRTGCSRAMALARIKEANQSPARRKQINELCKAWRKRQRKVNGPDAIRQRAINKQYRLDNLDKVKAMNKAWRLKNSRYIIHKNKQRELLKKALGEVTLSEWLDIKRRHKHRCALCGISEADLAIKWAGTGFAKLTMDHIIPLSKRGLNIAENIQPLCVSCNSSKHNKRIDRRGKILTSSQELAEWRQKQFGTVVATNGCFDLLHVAHIRYLARSKALGSSLIVGVNSDRTVSLLKGPDRPINNEQDRLTMLSAFTCVDAVFCVDSTDMAEFLKSVQPDIWTKGGDYTMSTLDKKEVAAAQNAGAQIALIPQIEGYSTTELLRRMQS
jgi:D-glycero-beta-D-manno-heptose 1-phosphate adenylyltransferase